MAMYRVWYTSMTASYGPCFISADSAEEARRIFAGQTFRNEMSLISATEVSALDVERALAREEEE